MRTKARKTSSAARPAHENRVPKPATSVAARRFLGLPKWTLILLLIVLVAGVSFAAFELFLPSPVPPELVGKWRVVGGPTDGMTLEFHRNGIMLGRATIDGKEGLIEGTAYVTGNTLHTTTTNPYTGKAETGTQTIVTLTETEFVSEDKNGTRITMTPVR